MYPYDADWRSAEHSKVTRAAALDALLGHTFSASGREARREIALTIMLRSVCRQARYYGIPATYSAMCIALDTRNSR